MLHYNDEGDNIEGDKLYVLRTGSRCTDAMIFSNRSTAMRAAEGRCLEFPTEDITLYEGRPVKKYKAKIEVSDLEASDT